MLARELFPGRFRPTLTHFFIRLLHDKGLLLRCYTQVWMCGCGEHQWLCGYRCGCGCSCVRVCSLAMNSHTAMVKVNFTWLPLS